MLSACDIGNPAYRRTDPRQDQGGVIRGKVAIYRGGDGESLVMVKIRLDWTSTPEGPEVIVYVLEPLPADVDDLEADLYAAAGKALEAKFISRLKVVR